MRKTVRVKNGNNEVVGEYPIDINFMSNEPDDRAFVAETMRAVSDDNGISLKNASLLIYEVR